MVHKWMKLIVRVCGKLPCHGRRCRGHIGDVWKSKYECVFRGKSIELMLGFKKEDKQE